MNPTEEAKLRNDAIRGERAQQILDNELFKEAIGLLKDGCLRELIAVPMVGIYPGQAEKLRMAAQLKLKLVEELVNVFAKTAESGRFAVWDLNARR